MSGNDLTIGISQPRNIDDRFELNIREAYWSEKVAEIENENVKHYKNLGIYKLIVTHINSKGTEEYMREYLAPIFEEEDKDGDLLQTCLLYTSKYTFIERDVQRSFILSHHRPHVF